MCKKLLTQIPQCPSVSMVILSADDLPHQGSKDKHDAVSNIRPVVNVPSQELLNLANGKDSSGQDQQGNQNAKPDKEIKWLDQNKSRSGLKRPIKRDPFWKIPQPYTGIIIISHT